MPRNVLIVEDDIDIAHLVQLQLRDIDCSSHIVEDGAEARNMLEERSDYDLLILDVMLPGCDGLSLCREFRAHNRHTPILILSAKSSELDRVLGLEIGADDYLTKPFSNMELTARVKALLRRCDIEKTTSPARNEVFEFDNLRINSASRQVLRGEAPIELTAREFELLVHFARNPERVFTREQLLKSVWGYSHSGYEHTVNTHINRLRRKIEPRPDSPRYIVTVWGVGYQFQPEINHAAAPHAVR